MNGLKAIFFGFGFSFFTCLSFGQNFGLTAPQDPLTLPKSAVSAQIPFHKPKVKAVSVLEKVHENEWIISGGWELAEANKVVAANQSLFSPELNTSQWYNATVPGTVLTTLVDQGIYPNPYFGLNNLTIPDSLCRIDWWYRTAIKLPNHNDGKNVWLLLNGINYKADIWLNGKQVGSIAGAFSRGEFNVTDYLNKKGVDILAVHIFPPANPGIPHEQSPSSGRGPNGGQLCLDGPTFISTEGWDWVPGIRDRNIGIWQDVRLRFSGPVVIGDTRIVTDLPLPDTTSARIMVQAELKNTTNLPQNIILRGEIENVVFEQTVSLAPGQKQLVSFDSNKFPQLLFTNPKLWWPNGYGKQNLYFLNLTATDASLVLSDTKSVRFGIREFSYEMTVDTKDQLGWRMEFNPLVAAKLGKPVFDNIHRREFISGTVWVSKLADSIDRSMFTEIVDKKTEPYLVIKINGQRIFCKGGNWGMDDAMKSVSRKHLEPYFKLHQQANFTMVRNWTGENSEEVFYELCDEYGLLVWNDFWLSTEGYNLNVNDNNLFLSNAKEVIRRFRNHPSIAIWCPRNEGYAPEDLEIELARLVVLEDGTRHYQPNSRYLNLRPSGPWHYFKNAADYFNIEANGLNTELGTPSVPSAASMRKMMDAKDLWPISDAWYYHDLHFGQKEYINAVDSLYGPSANLDDFCKKAQLVNYESHRAMFEAWNSKLWNNTTGLLLWMTHPAWPSVMWQVYSWDYETFGSYFASRKACEPLHIQMNLDNNRVVIVNTSLRLLKNNKMIMEIYGLDGKKMFQKDRQLDIPANQLTDCFTPQMPTMLQGLYLVRLKVLDQHNRQLSENEYLKSIGVDGFKGLNDLKKVTLRGKVLSQSSNDDRKVVFEVSNPSKTSAVSIKLNLKHEGTANIILPAYFSEGYFSLLPGETKKIKLNFETGVMGSLIITASGYNISNEMITGIHSFQ